MAPKKKPFDVGSLFPPSEVLLQGRGIGARLGKLESLLHFYREPLVRAIEMRCCRPRRALLQGGRFAAWESAEDVVHDFFVWLLNKPEVLNNYTGERRFRYFLLACLRNFWSDRVKHINSVTRNESLAWQAAAAALGSESSQALEMEMDWHWAQDLLERARLQLRAKYRIKGQETYFDSLWERVKGIDGPACLLAARFGVSASKISKDVDRLRSFYLRDALSMECEKGAASPEGARANWEDLLAILRKTSWL